MNLKMSSIDLDELDDIIEQMSNQKTKDPGDIPDDLVTGLAQVTIAGGGDRIRWPSGPYFPGDTKPTLTLITRDYQEIDLDHKASQLIRLLVSLPRFQDKLKDPTFVTTFLKDVERFSGVDLARDINKVNWDAVVSDIKEDPIVDLDTIAATHSVIYVDGKPYRQRQFSLPLPSIDQDGKITFPIQPSDVTFNKNDVAASWLVRWTNPNTGEENNLRFALTEPIEEELDLTPDDQEELDTDSDTTDLSDISSLSSDSSGSESDDAEAPKANKKVPFQLEVEEFTPTPLDLSVNFEALSARERSLPLNMLTSDEYQTQLLERARQTKGRLVKDLNRVFDVNLQRYYDDLVKVNDPMTTYFASYIQQRAKV